MYVSAFLEMKYTKSSLHIHISLSILFHSDLPLFVLHLQLIMGYTDCSHVCPLCPQNEAMASDGYTCGIVCILCNTFDMKVGMFSSP